MWTVGENTSEILHIGDTFWLFPLFFQHSISFTLTLFTPRVAWHQPRILLISAVFIAPWTSSITHEWLNKFSATVELFKDFCISFVCLHVLRFSGELHFNDFPPVKNVAVTHHSTKRTILAVSLQCCSRSNYLSLFDEVYLPSDLRSGDKRCGLQNWAR